MAARAALAVLISVFTLGLVAPSAGASWVDEATSGIDLDSMSAVVPAPDCVGPAGDPAPDSLAWQKREQDNDYCGEQRFLDTSTNPAFWAAKAAADARNGTETFEDPFRDPGPLNGIRFRYQRVSFTNASGQQLQGLLFRPCDATCQDRPPGLPTFSPPYPGVVIAHGGGATQEMYLWGAEGLAEAGYMVLTFQIPEPDNAAGDTHYANTKDALDYFESTPSRPTAAGDVNPLAGELDRKHVGLAGHSAGGVAVSRLGQEDPRVSAIVSWDRAQSSPMPPDLSIRTPALFLVADFNCQKVPVCIPQPYTSPPDPRGPGNKDEDYQRVSAASVDTMKVALRAATHLDFTQFSPGVGSRHGATVAFYYTLAWFDRYLKGAVPGNRRLAQGALGRLTATRFDDSADVHNTSGGVWDPLTLQNVPARIAGQPVADRLSFHFRSAYFLAGGRYRCEDVRAGCPPLQ
jgi:dienelactone hydrolase